MINILKIDIVYLIQEIVMLIIELENNIGLETLGQVVMQ